MRRNGMNAQHTASGSDAHDFLKKVLIVEEFEDVVPFLSLLLLGVVFAVWTWGAQRSSGKGEPQGNHVASTWLGTLAATSAVLLVFQAVLGYSSGSLTLIADMGHAAGDTVMYLAAYFAEKAKRDLASREVAPIVVSNLDAVAGATSTFLVAGVSIFAMIDSVQRLASPKPDRQGEDIRMIGPAILTFAVGSLLTNLCLLWVRFQCHGEDTQAKAVKIPADVSAAPPPATAAPESASVPPPPLPFEVQNVPAPPPPPVPEFSRTRPRRHGKLLLHQPSQQQQQDQQNQIDGQQQQAQQQRQPPARSSGAKWLHAMFHPGCDGNHAGFTDCAPPDQEAGEGSADEKADLGKEQAKPESKNLNLFGATLHLVTDVVRSLIVLVTGLLLEGGIIADVARTDAFCALVVGFCVLVGSAAFFCN